MYCLKTELQKKIETCMALVRRLEGKHEGADVELVKEVAAARPLLSAEDLDSVFRCLAIEDYKALVQKDRYSIQG